MNTATTARIVVQAEGFELGVYLETEIAVPLADGTGVYCYQRSPGLWGIDPSSGEDYYREIAREEYSTFADVLAALNVATPIDIDPTIVYR
jgi:hypothetical protein